MVNRFRHGIIFFFCLVPFIEAADLWLIPINGDIDGAQVSFVRREAQKAVQDGATCIVFEIDTFGGRVDSALHITSFITSLELRTVAWIRSGERSMGVSWSAGALIAFACDSIYMASGTSIGAAAPVTVSVSGENESAGEKTVAAVRSQMASLAERNGYPVGIALAMVDYDVELWEVEINGSRSVVVAEGIQENMKKIQQVSARGKLLSLTTGEAQRYGLIQSSIDNQEELKAVLDATAITEAKRDFADNIIILLNTALVQTVLIILGISMIFLEIHSPGFGIPGTTAIIAFALVFGASAFIGTLDSAEIILFLIGLSLLAIELFVLPGFGIAGMSGIVLIGLALVLSMQDFIIPQFDWQWGMLGRNVVVVIAALCAALAGIALLMLAGPRIHLFNVFIQHGRITGTAGGDDCGSDFDFLVDNTGITRSILRPVGTADINGSRYSVESDGTFIEQGTLIKVHRVIGNRIIVHAVSEIQKKVEA
ncbi:putative membrane-bound serine protease (ClpP class) [Pillotina sp. SPG140]|jgi:membrane-bound serine protease (ClpP class)